MRTHGVYIIFYSFTLRFKCRVKIGQTKNHDRRLREYQTHLPIVAFSYWKETENHVSLEKKIHGQFKEYRKSRREFFELSVWGVLKLLWAMR